MFAAPALAQFVPTSQSSPEVRKIDYPYLSPEGQRAEHLQLYICCGSLQDKNSRDGALATLKGLLHAATSEEFRIFVDCTYTWESRWPRPTSGVNNLLTLVANDGLIDINSLMNLGRSNDVLYYISTKVTPPPPAPIAPHINFVLPRRSAMCVRQRCQCVWALGGRVSPGWVGSSGGVGSSTWVSSGSLGANFANQIC